MNKISSKTDISTWVANANPFNYLAAENSQECHDAVVEALRAGNHPEWETDWSEYLDGFDYSRAVGAIAR